MEESLVSMADIRAAAARIADIAVTNPLVRSPFPGFSDPVRQVTPSRRRHFTPQQSQPDSC
jgi:hypothetical protein